MVSFNQVLNESKANPTSTPKRMKFSELQSLHNVEGQDPIQSPTKEIQKVNSRGVLDRVKFFFGETTKSVARGIEMIPAGLEGVLQVGLKNLKEITSNQLKEDGAVFGISEEQFRNRTPEQSKRIARNNKIYQRIDSAIKTSERLQQNWIEATQTGIEAPSEEFLKSSPIPFTENFSLTRMIALGTESVPMLGLAAVVTAATKSPIAGASVIGTIEAAEEFNKASDSGLSQLESNMVFVSNALMLSALESVPLTSFLKGGSLPLRAFKTATQEGSEEVLQSLWRDSIAKIGYDETRDLTEGLLESFIGGFISGGVIGSFGPSDIEVKVNNAKKKGVDVDQMTEVISQQAIDNAENITDSFSEKVSVEQKTIEDPDKKDNIVRDQTGRPLTINVERSDGSEYGEIYRENIRLKKQEKFYTKPLRSASEIVSDGSRAIDETFGTISTRAANISEKFRDELRKYEFRQFQELKKYEEGSKGFLEKFNYKNMKEDFQSLDLALKNRDIEKSDAIIKKYGIEEEYKKVRNLLDEMPKRAEDVGIKMGFVENYFPRSVSDVKGLLSELRNEPNWNIIEEALRQEEKKLGYKLSPADEARVVTQMLSGYGDNQIRIGGTNFSKRRTIDILDPKYDRYYKPGSESLLEYFRAMNSMIEGRKLLGRESPEVSKIRSDLRKSKSNIEKIKDSDSSTIKKKKLSKMFRALEDINIKVKIDPSLKNSEDIQSKLESLSDYIDILKKMKPDIVKSIELKKITKRVEDLENEILQRNTNIEQGIGDFVNRLAKDKVISQDQVDQVVSIIRSRLSPKGIENRAVIALRDAGYLATLNDVTNGITQLGDLFLSVYKNNIVHTLASFSDMVSGKTKVTREDLGIGEVISSEFDSLRNRDKANNFIIKYSLIKPFDNVGKTTFINASLKMLQSKAKKNNPELISELERVFGNEAKIVLSDLSSGKITDNIKYLLFAELSNIQPISLSEVPENYLKLGNYRIVYMLKTFALKALDIARNDAYNEIRKGNYKKGASNLFKLSITFALMGATTGALKDFILGRDFEIEEDAIDGLLQLLMLNRYIGFYGKRDGYIRSWLNSQIPPFYKLIDDFAGDVFNRTELPKWKSIRNVPLTGEPFYWWFGGGVEKKSKKNRRKSSF